VENQEKQEERKRSIQERREMASKPPRSTAEINRRDQVTAANFWRSSLRKEGTEVDYQELSRS
jgi:hypothetical protein